MKRMVLLIPLVVLLALTFAASPVAACVEREQRPSMGRSWLMVPVSATQAGAQISSSMEEKCGRLYINAQTAGTVNYDLKKDGTIDFTFSSTGNQRVIINIKTGKGVIDFEPMRWILKDADGQEIGAFEGHVHGEITEYTLTPKWAWTGVVHVVFRGSGVFAGQTLVLEGTRTKIVNTDGSTTWTPLVWEGFTLTRHQ